LEVYSHSIVAALRMSISFLVLLPLAIQSFKIVDKKYWKYLIATGFLGNGIPAFLFTKAQTEISSSLSGMLNSSVPIFALIVGVLLFQSKPIRLQIIGVVVGLIGTIGLISTSSTNMESSNIIPIFLVILATVCYAFSVNIIKTYLKEINSIHITSLAFLSIGPFTTAYLIGSDFLHTSIHHPSSGYALFYIIILSVFGTAISVILFNMLIKKTSTLFATSVTYLIPIVAIFWGVIDQETITFLQITSILIILIGVYFINKK